ncbi:branched-chain amino acid ABC transporter ATP-binding protein/permease [Achromobacter sp. MFA1 R4]|uniref:branched-chain amino acid ABC transporter ATP-binding protein/permease n=1 Tax=Achromobacter sp. MFA1 R4 TaxID=1881016 RepID=UPI0009538482|nr:branched-chain amino acid ABC transporter ATP-binding protein/permease [Achromobacter sp. MFA1 R4]SIT21243.1 monosaccharide ABC transporter ATP-binding protein, CUT2 family [Achromobacter sp. MFA1 R4]
MNKQSATRWLPPAIYALLAAAALALAATVNGYYVFVLGNVALLALAGIGLNVLLGLTGQMSFGHAGFYAIGAYTVAILTGQAGWSFWLAWPAAALVCSAFGLLLAVPALRVKGPYLAMITIAFGFIVEHALIEGGSLTGGQNGLMGIVQPAIGSLGGDRGVAMLAIVAVFVALAAYALLSRGAWGAAMRAVKDSETASESIGINPLAVKAVAFMVSAALVGLAGGLYAPLTGMITPHNFNFMQSILFVLAVTIGGAGSLAGPLLGAVVVGLLPEMLSSLEEYRLLFFGVFLLVVLWAAPEGAAGLLARWRRGAPAHGLAPRHGAMPTSARARRTLRADALTMTFGGVRAVQGVSFTVPPGAVTALIGPNGAGKSTVINMLSGYYQPTSGAVALGDAPLAALAAHRVARSGIARTYQTSQLFDTLSVEDNVALGLLRGRLGGLLASRRYLAADARERARALLAFCGYEGALDIAAADLPHVDRRLVEIARALATDADILLMDEPAAGLSREDKTRLAGLLRRIAEAGAGVLLVEHDMTLVMGVSDHIVAIDAGRELAQGSVAEIQQSPEVRQAYLGDEAARRAPAARRRPAGETLPPEVLGVGSLTTGYGANPVLHGIDLQVRQGEMVALLGANGAGKSTLMRTLAGLHRPAQGGMHLQGQELQGLSADRIVARGLVLVPEGRQVFPGLSVLDNIRLGAFLHPQDREARVEEMLTRFPRLRERLHQRAGLLSGGEQQMLAIARGLMSRPVILLLDEPSLGLAPKIIDELFEALDRLRQESMTILLVDQMAALALSLADRAYVLESGRVAAHGAAADIAQDGALARAYLGA